MPQTPKLTTNQSAYETLYASLDTAFSLTHVTEFFDRILAGIDDEQDIRTISNFMTSKLITLAPEETQRYLDALSERYSTVLIDLNAALANEEQSRSIDVLWSVMTLTLFEVTTVYYHIIL